MNIGVIFWSRSPEHDVSIASAFGVIAAIEKHTQHTAIPLYIKRDGSWVIDEALKDIKEQKNIENYKATILPDIQKNNNNGKTYVTHTTGFISKKKSQIDCLRNICHGENGEDATINSFARLINLPIISPGNLGETIGMNKDMMKQLFASRDLPLVPYLTYAKGQEDIEEIEKTLNYPLFVKPVSCGSTIGISKVENQKELVEAIEVAGYFDHEIMIENAVGNCREFNCSVMEKDNEVISSRVEEPQASNAEFLTFHEKYTSETGATMKGSKATVTCPADISTELTQQIQKYSKDIYKKMKLTGGAPRVDFLYNDQEKKLYVNEINMTPGTMQIHLRHQSKMNLNEFIQWLINTAIKYHKQSQKNTDFQNNVIDYTITILDNMKK